MAEPLFRGWRTCLSRGEAVEAFEDMFLAPVPMVCAVNILQLLALDNRPGILQVSASYDQSYAGAARLVARSIQADESLVRPTPTPRHLRPTPRFTSLSIEGLRQAFGIEPPDPEWT